MFNLFRTKKEPEVKGREIARQLINRTITKDSHNVVINVLTGIAQDNLKPTKDRIEACRCYLQ